MDKEPIETLSGVFAQLARSRETRDVARQLLAEADQRYEGEDRMDVLRRLGLERRDILERLLVSQQTELQYPEEVERSVLERLIDDLARVAKGEILPPSHELIGNWLAAEMYLDLEIEIRGDGRKRQVVKSLGGTLKEMRAIISDFVYLVIEMEEWLDNRSIEQHFDSYGTKSRSPASRINKILASLDHDTKKMLKQIQTHASCSVVHIGNGWKTRLLRELARATGEFKKLSLLVNHHERVFTDDEIDFSIIEGVFKSVEQAIQGASDHGINVERLSQRFQRCRDKYEKLLCPASDSDTLFPL